ncbi:alpha/beta fold hydrolase [uncultured Tateyamaria sp.]|uniref:alpha/beta fold hydrolase n=1 Tax=uncultured Tateyamaria sp. TaxID=455651 RepID=UPI00260926AD|nr:alpha/beta fold hydrolase [uncultured Tateyamaria sp.]
MPTLDRADITLHYEVTGDGPPLLMLAGFMSDNTSWTPLVPLLSDHFTCITPDNRTTGRTTPWDAPVSIDLMCKDALALMDHLGHDRYHVIGHSMGGIIAMHMAQDVPERLASTHIAASAPVRLPRNTALFANMIAIRRSDAPPDTWLRALFPWLFNPLVFHDPSAVDLAVADSLAYPYAQSADAMEHQLTALRGFDGTALASPTCPTQVLIGALDLIVPPDHILAVLSHLPHHILEGAGHSIHWDAPENVADLLRAYAAKHPI